MQSSRSFLGVFLVIGFAASLPSTAGVLIGNGGNAVICRNTDGKIQSAELLDYYEARVQSGLRSNLGSADLSYIDKVRLALTRLGKYSPRRAALYLAKASDFMSETAFVEPDAAGLTPIPDIAPDVNSLVSPPPGCKIQQLAIQHVPKFPGDKRYMVQKEIWNALDEQGRAGLILHEIIYREALDSYQTDSVSTRYFTAFLSQEHFPEMSVELFLNFLQNDIVFLTAEAHGYELLLWRCQGNVETGSNGHPFCNGRMLKSKLDFERGHLVGADLSRKNPTSIAIGTSLVDTKAIDALDDHNFSPVRVRFASGRVVAFRNELNKIALHSMRYNFPRVLEVAFDARGDLSGLDWDEDVYLFETPVGPLHLQGPSFVARHMPGLILSELLTTFSPDEMLESGYLAEDRLFTDTRAQQVTLHPSNWFKIDRSGRLLSSLFIPDSCWETADKPESGMCKQDGYPSNRIHRATMVTWNSSGYSISNGLIDYFSADPGFSISGPARIDGYTLYTIATPPFANKRAYYVSTNPVADATTQPYFSAFGKMSATQSMRMWLGLGNGLHYGYTDHLPNVNFVGALFRYSSSARDTNFMAVTSNGTAQAVVDTGVGADDKPHLFAIYFSSASSIQFYIDGKLVATSTSDVPVGPLWQIVGSTSLSSNPVSFSFSRIDVETN